MVRISSGYFLIKLPSQPYYWLRRTPSLPHDSRRVANTSQLLNHTYPSILRFKAYNPAELSCCYPLLSLYYHLLFFSSTLPHERTNFVELPTVGSCGSRGIKLHRGLYQNLFTIIYFHTSYWMPIFFINNHPV